MADALAESMLEAVFHWERTRPDRPWLTQPMGGGVVRDLTWRVAVDEARRMAAHLRARGLPPGSSIAILTKNCAHFFLADLAIWMAGHVAVPLYPTANATTIRQILTHSEARLLFVGKLDAWPSQAPGVPAGLPLIALPLAPKLDAPTWDELIAKTEPLGGAPTRSPDDLATIIYTSGSTGVPKGVMHSFGAMAASCRAMLATISTSPEDRVLSYLPLAHVAERVAVECPSMFTGGRVFFAESLETFVDDLKRARPTLFFTVPRLWQKFQQGVFGKMPPAKLDRLLSIPIVSSLVKRKILKGLGLDSVRLAASGAAPMSHELMSWYRRLGLELLEGYGMTENFACSHATRPGRVRVGYVGEPYAGVDCRISDEGEVQIKSPGMMLGYFKAPELTAEAFTPDGYLRTGDRGEIDELGRLRITGRVKELFKTSQGQVRRAGADRRQARQPPGHRSGVRGWPRPPAALRPRHARRRSAPPARRVARRARSGAQGASARGQRRARGARDAGLRRRRRRRVADREWLFDAIDEDPPRRHRTHLRAAPRSLVRRAQPGRVASAQLGAPCRG